jgi:hypothetical protein
VRKGETPVIVNKTAAKDKSTHTISEFLGRWQEVSRRDRQSNKPVDFTDTLYYHFTGNNNVFTRDGVNMSLRGKASIEPGNELLAAADVFDIKSLNQHMTILDDREKYIHILMRKNQFWYETFPTTSITQEKYTVPVSASARDLIGNWMVYRRDAEPGSTSGDNLIRTMNLSGADGNIAYGSLTSFHADKTDSLSCTVTLDGQHINIVTKKYAWNLTVYKADGRELVFGNENLKYFCKPW